ncbi:hypothetical protein CPJCM30710_00980 [Clostridium polyendosporum]|uniref:Uncharacterized protein n=1 Tax=Clostridium polyendosporum TaxID=69208 RepID=A0A919RVU7_9CLOT|nr:hypothetical protein [Clostridium polyendosporum]GIM27432.1 hypothetical protein CPJCM30710_00980 [Clostridium polyendosporum]
MEGEPLPSYIKKRGLTQKLAKNIIDLVEEFKRLGFTKIDIMAKHIFVDNQQNIMVIDPRKTYTTNYPYPTRIVRTLKKLNLFDDFLKILSNYKPHLISFWTKKD